MLASHKIKPGLFLPSISIRNTQGKLLDLSCMTNDKAWRLIVIYWGLSCPYCREYLQNINQLVNQFSKIHVEIMAISGDSEKNAHHQAKQDNLSFAVGYGLAVDEMVSLGLFISHPEPTLTSNRPIAEPAIFVTNGEGQVVLANISNSPLCFPDIHHILSGLSHMQQEAFTIRGTYDPLSPL